MIETEAFKVGIPFPSNPDVNEAMPATLELDGVACKRAALVWEDDPDGGGPLLQYADYEVEGGQMLRVHAVWDIPGADVYLDNKLVGVAHSLTTKEYIR